MFIRYKGLTPKFNYKGVDFSKGPAEVEDNLGKDMIAESPGCFCEVIKAAPVAKPVAKPVKAPAKK
jgi:hypothetical protein